MPDTADYGPHETEAVEPLPQALHGTLSVEEYLNTSYSPDREYLDGLVLERNVGDKDHSLLQASLAHYFRRRRKQWNIEVYTELRVQIRPNWYPIPDVCVYMLPDFEGPYPSQPPVLWIEILSPSDTAREVWRKTQDLLAGGVPRVWIIDPRTLAGELHTLGGIQRVGAVLAISDTPIEITLSDIMTE
jgi:Uma2 family endonuclease